MRDQMNRFEANLPCPKRVPTQLDVILDELNHCHQKKKTTELNYL